MAEKKITKRDVLNHIIETYPNDTMVIEYAKNEIELLDKKRNANSEKSKEKAVEREKLKNVILNVLIEKNDWVMVKDINSANDTMKELSNQKITYLLTEMLKRDETIEKKVDKNSTKVIKKSR